MSLARLYMFFTYGSVTSYDFVEFISSLWLGLRLDASVLAYVFSIPILLLFFVWLFNLKFLQKYLYKLFRIYFIIIVSVVFVFIFADFAYFSFFGEHSTLMIFGVFDDDTQALIRTAFENYNIALILFLSLLILSILYYLVFKIIQPKQIFTIKWSFFKQFGFFLFLIVFVALLGRGSFGLFPLAYNTPDPTSDQFLNKLSKTSVFSIVDSYEAYKKSKNGNYDLIKDMGYDGRINEAFKVQTQKDEIDENNLLNNIRYKTQKNELLEKKPPNVVVVMVESFGMPLLQYQSKNFNIMGRIKKHFDEDTLFKNFISTSNGTIVSLEPLLLNITARPYSTAFAQGKYLNTEFIQASARVYEKAGYETSFIYGGDLSWRNVGNFISKQGFEHVDGSASIAKELNRDKDSISHDWGVFDEYLYKYVEHKLKNSKKPQFVFVLTTNNHPPYKIPKEYKSNRLEISKKLKEHITGDIELAKKRFKDYAYAVDMAGKFLDDIKDSNLSKNTVVVITADNNTIEGIMKYDDYNNETKKIPFYIYMPKYIKKDFNTQIASSHKDIFPTLYNMTLSDVEYMAIGTDLYDKNKLHCGFNDVGIIMSQDGAFKLGNAKTDLQKRCQEYYKASLAVTEYLIKSQKK
jgi:phosphoglycerol transferase MdoB-like AlkP superfamily enzyme